MKARSGSKDPGISLLDLIRPAGIFLFIALLVIPATQTPPDLMNNFQNLSKIAPINGAPGGNVSEEMSQYNNWMGSMAASMMSFFNQIMNVFGMGNLNGPANTSGNLQNTLQQVTQSRQWLHYFSLIFSKPFLDQSVTPFGKTVVRDIIGE